ncbi:MAG: hypothetical protein L6302_04740 [Desulfobacteraceae bacterium]|nr:hypothetical protein [Desulfobacteraceae bacterium]
MVFNRVRRGSHGVHCSHALFRFDLQAATTTADMSDIESVLVLVDMQVIPFFPLVRKQDIPNAVQSGQLVGEITQFLH